MDKLKITDFWLQIYDASLETMEPNICLGEWRLMGLAQKENFL